MNINKFNTAVCLFCEINATYDELPVCRNCIGKLQSVLDEKCNICGMRAEDCRCNNPERVHFLFFFDCPASRLLIYWMKTSFDRRRMDFFAELMLVNSNINPAEFDAVTYVPRRKRNIKIFGYDQAKELAKSVSRVFGIPLVCSLKRVNRGDQKFLSYTQRKISARNNFALCCIPEKKFKKILIVDDIITTGATIEVCAEKLRKGFAEMVVPMVLAKTNRAQ